jgi:hypothetical protein
MSHKYRTTKDHIFAWALIQQGEQLIYFPDGKLEYMNFTGKIGHENNFTNREEFIKLCKSQRVEFLLPDSWVKIKSEQDYPAYLDSDGEEVHEGYYDKDDKVFRGEEAIPFPKGWVKYWRIMPLAPGNK